MCLAGLKDDRPLARHAVSTLGALGLPTDLDVLAPSDPFRREADLALFVEGFSRGLRL
ncbi:MAG: hypothetical protein AAF318_04440 [Pseudomonadota bacterium]